MRKCSLNSLSDIFSKISESNTLYLPVDTNEGAAFKKWEEGTVMSEALNTNRSAKDFFFPQTEDLMEFTVNKKEIEIIDTRKESEDFVVFGVRACDMRSFEILDRVFLTEPYDSYYATKREHSTIVTLCCTRPNETCFCTAFDIDPTNAGGDVTAYKTEEEIFFKSNTPKGEAFMKMIEAFTEETSDDSVNEIKDKTKAILKKLPLADLSKDSFGGGKTEELFEREEWEELSSACLGCGTCTFVCPTCQCYDIKDYNTGKGVIRYRCWDSCMYSDFTKMAHGNSRNTQIERFRQRFMHKLVYFPENNDGIFGCVGCGRCLSKCPISMNIVKVMKTLGGDK